MSGAEESQGVVTFTVQRDAGAYGVVALAWQLTGPAASTNFVTTYGELQFAENAEKLKEGTAV